MGDQGKAATDLTNSEIKTIEDLIARVKSYYPTDIDLEILKKAYSFSEQAHQGQFRRSGEAYISHPLSVAGILAELQLDIHSIMTGLLHDTVEDTSVQLIHIEKEFGKDVAQLVDGVTKISRISFRNTHQKQGENFRKMLVAMGKDIRVILVKLADRLHNMRTLNHMPYDKQSAIAQETLEIYSPLANRLGISAWKIELEELSLRFSKPDIYYSLAQKVAKKKKEREAYIDQVKYILDQHLKADAVQADVQGRPKTLYSIYKKMVLKNIDYDQVYDVLGFRILVDGVAQCYEALGIVHSLFKPIPGRFKDYIAMAKTNNYQSLHTAVVGPDGERIEIQIRTHEMHLVAELGIAAHWKYKETGQVDHLTEKKFNWLRELVSWHQQVRDSDEFLENVKNDLFETEIYVFTPKGEVKELPEGATPLDFSYSVHTELGNRTVGAKVNGRIVPLKHVLSNGDTIEIITSQTQKPSKDWLKFCVTTRAQSKIRQFIRNEERLKATELGQGLLEKEFRRFEHSFNKFIKTAKMEEYLKSMGLSSIEELQMQVGFGKLLPIEILQKFVPDIKKSAVADEPQSLLGRIFQNATRKSRKSNSLVQVDGMEDVLVRYGKCCNPIPGDPIQGAISRGRGVTIHQSSCPRIYDTEEERRVTAEWTLTPDTIRSTKVKVVSNDAPGLLRTMGDCFATHGINISNANISTNKDQKAICIFEVTVKSKSQLMKLIQDLQKIKGVIEVERMIHS